MKLRWIFGAMVALFFCRSIAAAQEAAPQQQSEDERRREADRIARERAMEEERKKQDQARREEFDKLRPPTPAERAAFHKRQFPEFIRNVRKFDLAARELAGYAAQPALDRSAEKAIEKKAKSLEGRIDDVMGYILDGANRPAAPSDSYGGKSLTERLQLLGSLSSRAAAQLKVSIAQQRKSVVDAKVTLQILQDLQSLKLLTRSMRQ